jgi:alkylhydroperoxidase family enzyme
MLDYALALTRNPGEVGPEHVEALRKARLSDEEIHRVAAVVAYFNFVNRIAEGLGVELESPALRSGQMRLSG